MDYSRMARKLRGRIAAFSGELSRGLPKVAERFVREMVYGIQASQSVVLTKIGRTLEDGIDQEGGGATVAAVVASGVRAEDSGESPLDGRSLCRGGDVAYPGSERHTEEVREEDAVCRDRA